MKRFARPRWGVKARVSAVGVVATALVLGGATAAHAEGNFKSYMTQVQPTFTSRSWEDKNRDGASTIVKLSNCKVNAGGKVPGSSKLKSIKVTLHYGGGKTKSLTQACGTYNYGRVSADNYNSFEITAINGQTARGAKMFLNADVAVSY